MNNNQNSAALSGIRSDILGARAAITISNPARRNAMSLAMWGALRDAVLEADANPEIRLITVRGDQGTFVSGADIAEFEKVRSNSQDARHYEETHDNALDALRRATTPTIALIEGDCMGGGLAIAACCDLRVAALSARFAIPAAKLGIAYPIPSVHDLSALVGPAMTKWLLFTANRLDATAMQGAGFLQAVYDDESFGEEAEALCDLILSRAPLTQRAAKTAVNVFLCAATLEEAKRDSKACFDSDDYQEGWTSFLEKRAPHFKGR